MWEHRNIEVVEGNEDGSQVDGMSMFDVCDQDSQRLYEAYEALFDDKGEFQPELNIDEPADSLIFVWRAVLHSNVRPYL